MPGGGKRRTEPAEKAAAAKGLAQKKKPGLESDLSNHDNSIHDLDLFFSRLTNATLSNDVKEGVA